MALNRALSLLIALMVEIPCLAQTTAPLQGITPWGSYDMTAIDTVNVENGNVVLNIPILSYKQKGKLPTLTLSLTYNDEHWTTLHMPCADPSCQNHDYYEVNYDEPTLSNAQNYPTTGVQAIMNGRVGFDLEVAPIPDLDADDTGNYFLYYLYDPLGQRHPMGLNTRTNNAETTDGSNYVINGNTAISSEGVTYAGLCASGAPANCGRTIQDLDGNTIFEVTTDGNWLSPSVSWQDSIGRTIPAPPDLVNGCAAVIYPGVTGQAYQGTDAQFSVTFCYTQISIHSQFNVAVSPDRPVTEWQGSISGLSSITLPDGSQWTFTYDPTWGDLIKITTPTGGVIQYTWQTVSTHTDSDTEFAYIAERAVKTRTLLDANGHSAVWNYCYGTSSNCALGTSSGVDSTGLQTTVTDPLQNVTVHTFAGHLETETDYYDASSNLVKTVATSLAGSYGGYLSNYNGQGEFPEWSAPVGVTTTLYPSGVSQFTCINYTDNTAYAPDSTQCGVPAGVYIQPAYQFLQMGYDALKYEGGGYLYTPAVLDMAGSYVLPSVKETFDYATGKVGALLSASHTSYIWQGSTAYESANLLGLAAAETIAGANGNVVSETDYVYDENNGSPQGQRGNLTTATSKNPAGSDQITSTIYNAEGMPTCVTAAAPSATGTVGTHYFYDGTGLFLNSRVYGLPGDACTGSGMAESYEFDANTGSLLTYTDANGVKTKTEYNDALGRVTRTKHFFETPQETWIQYSYPSPNETQTARDLSAKGDGVLTTDEQRDGFNRTISSTETNGSTVDTIYDLAGRKQAVSNPYVSASGKQYSSFAYDALGRMTMLCRQDNGGTDATVCQAGAAYQSYSYLGNAVTFADEVGNSWTRTFDALGRLINTAENGNAATPLSQSTAYEYDALGNLITVTPYNSGAAQSGRGRIFQYDALSHLMYACNPEGIPVGSSCDGNHWSAVYTYYGDGSLKTKTDARGIEALYAYDNYGRITSVVYTASAKTPASCYAYDTVQPYGIGRLAASWTSYSMCGTTVPTTGTVKVVGAYFANGQEQTESQCTPINCNSHGINPYVLNFAYDLAGHQTQINDGLGLNVWMTSYLYTDPTSGRNTGQLQSVSEVGGQSTSFAPGILLNAQGYAPSGIMTSWTLGVNGSLPAALIGTRSVDSRLRISAESVTGHD